jgi:paraquat-inducible protein B
MSKRTQPALVGTFVLGGMAMIVGLALFFGSGRLSRETLTLVSFFEADVSGLREGAPVSFRGVDVGAVSQVLLTLPDDPRTGTTDVRIAVIFDVDMERLRSVAPSQRRDLTDPVVFEEVIQAGMRVGLKTNNLLAGIKSLTLDLRPDVPDTRFQGVELPYWEVPTMPSPLVAVQAELQEMANRLVDLPLDSIAVNINGLVTDLRRTINSEETSGLGSQANRTLENLALAAGEISTFMSGLGDTVEPVVEGLNETFTGARELMDSLEETLAQIRAQTGPESPLTYRTLQLLEETDLVLQSLRDFIEYLKANPSALIKGRSDGGE